MKVIIFGATGMVGQGVLRECLLDPDVTAILSIGRGTTGQTTLLRQGFPLRQDSEGQVGGQAPKLTEVVHKDFTDFSSLESRLRDYDACFFCLGVSSLGMSEKDYRHITFDFAMAAASVLAKQNPGMTFIYVSGMGTDSTEKGKIMWARVKGETENVLLNLPFKAVYLFRPGFIQPLDGIVPKNKWLKIVLGVLRPIIPLLKTIFPKSITTTRLVGRAMINAAKNGVRMKWIESFYINELGKV